VTVLIQDLVFLFHDSKLFVIAVSDSIQLCVYHGYALLAVNIFIFEVLVVFKEFVAGAVDPGDI